MSIEKAREVIRVEAEGLLSLEEQIGPEFDQAIDLIMACPSRVILTGIGKSGIIAQKIAATLNSTGTASFFLHPVEAMHGDLGIVDPRDVILCISYSGETTELNLLLTSLQGRNVSIIAMTGNAGSTMARLSDVILRVAVPREACPLGLAPTASTTAALAMGDALAVVLLEKKRFKASDFRRNHPGGSLGERLKVNVSEVMITGEEIPRVLPATPLADAIRIMNEKNLGAVLVVDGENRVAGILTDGDIRRLVASSRNIGNRTAADDMTPSPKTIQGTLLAADALSIMQRHEITTLPVTGQKGELIGILHLHDLLGKGEFRFLV